MNTNIHSQLDGPNMIDFVQEFYNKSKFDKLKVQMVIMKMILMTYGHSEVFQLCVTCV